jgi:hypothetical protein
MIRQLGCALAVVVVGAVLFTSSASAHVLKVDGTIGAVLHVEPDDDPVAGTPSKLELEFDDTTGTFKMSNCICKIEIRQSGKNVASKDMVAGGETEGHLSYTFQKAGEYSVLATGTPKQPGDFQKFSLRYDVHATSREKSAQPIPILLWVGLGLLVVLLLLASMRL